MGARVLDSTKATSWSRAEDKPCSEAGSVAGGSFDATLISSASHPSPMTLSQQNKIFWIFSIHFPNRTEK